MNEEIDPAIHAFLTDIGAWLAEMLRTAELTREAAPALRTAAQASGRIGLSTDDLRHLARADQLAENAISSLRSAEAMAAEELDQTGKGVQVDGRRRRDRPLHRRPDQTRSCAAARGDDGAGRARQAALDRGCPRTSRRGHSMTDHNPREAIGG